MQLIGSASGTNKRSSNFMRKIQKLLRTTSTFTSDVSSMYCLYKPLDLYPVQIAENKTAEAIQATHPTSEEFKAGEEMI
jgi:hypothetical protein